MHQDMQITCEIFRLKFGTFHIFILQTLSIFSILYYLDRKSVV